MGRISTNFTREENRCKCGVCNQFGADIEQVNVLEEIRAHLRANVLADAIIVPTSWFRCIEHNNRPKNQFSAAGVRGVGSNSKSWHPTGGATDYHSPGISPVRLAKEFRILYPHKYGLGLYNWGIHSDVRPKKAFWDERT